MIGSIPVRFQVRDSKKFESTSKLNNTIQLPESSKQSKIQNHGHRISCQSESPKCSGIPIPEKLGAYPKKSLPILVLYFQVSAHLQREGIAAEGRTAVFPTRNPAINRNQRFSRLGRMRVHARMHACTRGRGLRGVERVVPGFGQV